MGEIDWKRLYPGIPFKKCSICGKETLVSYPLGICEECIREWREGVSSRIEEVHRRIIPGGKCNLCVNRCGVVPGACRVVDRKRVSLEWYYDPLPTNCVAAFVCGETHGKNLAVFYTSCTFDCLFCQNWHFRITRGKKYSADELLALVDEDTRCICFFGGDPASVIEHTIEVGEKAKVKVCWETNGSENPEIMKRVAELALKTGGIVKIDLKALDKNLHLALTGSSNEFTLENVKNLGRIKRELPLLVVSTLLVPGYVGPWEVERIAALLSSINPDIPLSLLAFYPAFRMNDLPCTSGRHAFEAKERAEKYLKNVHIGNVHLLW